MITVVTALGRPERTLVINLLLLELENKAVLLAIGRPVLLSFWIKRCFIILTTRCRF